MIRERKLQEKRKKTPAQNETLMTNSLTIPFFVVCFWFKGWEVNVIIMIIILTKKR